MTVKSPRLWLILALCALVVAAGCVAVERLDTRSPVPRVAVVPVKGLLHEVTLVQTTDLHGVEFGRHEGATRAELKGEEGEHPGTNEIQFLPDLRGFLVDGTYERAGQRVYVATGLGVTWFHARFLDRSDLVLYRFVPER
ncbi:MAG TPA: hypothetical protein VGK50_01340 [Coriobacteriia bacterium]|jgi:hypothetical protein